MLQKPIPAMLKEMVEEAYKEYRETFDEDELIQILLSLAANSRETFFILDGLDECRPDERKTMLDFFVQLLQATVPSSTYRVFISSREDFYRSQRILSCVGLPIHDTDLKSDITNYVVKTVDHRREKGQLNVRDENLVCEIKDKLINGAEGMFLWVKFQIDALCEGTSDDNIKTILSKLPKGLDETYGRCLEKIVSGQSPLYAFNALRWVSHARRPLLVEELEEAITISPIDGRPDASKRPNTSTVNICANLVVIDESDGTGSVRLAHHTVKEFLEQPMEEPKAKKFLQKFGRNELSSFDFGPNDLEVGESCALKSLCKKGVTNGDFALHIVAKKGYVKVAELLLAERVRVDSKDYQGRTALQRAAASGHKEVVDLLLEAKADVDAKNNGGLTALYQAAENGHEEVVRLLLEAEADVDAEDSEERTALHRAALNGHKGVVQLLLEKGVDVDAKDNEERTALYWAALNGHEGVARLLLEKGADVDMKGTDGLTMLYNAGNKGRDGLMLLYCAAEKGHERVVQLLLEKGVDITANNWYRYTALHVAAQKGHKAVVQLLLEEGADVNAKDWDRLTALHSAALNGHDDVVRLLLEKWANINAEDKEGRTALYLAALNGHKAVVRVLLEKGAEVDVKDWNGRTALHSAALNGHKEVVRLLEAEAEVAAKVREGIDGAALGDFEWV
ncbi:hypothetical protein DL771_008737 [Monosporascus sp. 5C6A]|nr:hypothetical protein DL771_008737 [Monosporascus sp. 5C6A]